MVLLYGFLVSSDVQISAVNIGDGTKADTCLQSEKK